MRTHIFTLWIIVLAAICVYPVNAQMRPLRNTSLLDRATKITSATDWVRPYYTWKDARTLIAFRGERGDDSGRILTFLQVDALTGAARPSRF